MARKVDATQLAAEYGRAADRFVADSQKQFAKFEGSTSRVITLKETYDELAGLTQSQESLFKQALLAIEIGLHRAAVVLAWAAFMDVVQSKLASDGWKKVSSVRSTFPAAKTLEEIREQYTDHAFVSIAKECGLYGKGTMNSLHGALADRNQCAHPGAPDPGMNEALGYVSKLLKRAKEIQSKSL
ncbi:MAG: hypothetical protein HONBIEJF_00037 [Fimbriimonadaceae bacterium]|nr:hypothetical protein [Fimbriimonadaceae bacterium]